jgi:adenylate cyclase
VFALLALAGCGGGEESLTVAPSRGTPASVHSDAMARTLPPDEYWRAYLTGELPKVVTLGRGFFQHLPAPPRCKLCFAPFGRPGSMLMRLFGGGPSAINRRVCRWCIKSIEEQPGGAEVEISVLFADVRGSTALAERTSPGAFSELIARFYGTAARVVDRWDGIVDKFVGDEAVALFIPGFAGDDHATDAIAAARDLLREAANGGGSPWIPLGAGVHTGVAYVGTVGEQDALDFTALGDTVNTGSRLGAAAGLGEILVSDAAAAAGGLDTSGLERRTLVLRGREQAVDTWVVTA